MPAMLHETPAQQIRRLSSSSGVQRGPLLGGLAFLDGSGAGWGCWELAGWLEDHLVGPGRLPRLPSQVHEAELGSIAIDPRWSEVRRSGGLGIEHLPRLLEAARTRILETLGRFLPPTGDDGFLHAAIFGRRVVRAPTSAGSTWVPTVRESDGLSDIVLALFAADVLAHREFHDANLCVCRTCGTVTFEPPAREDHRATCAEHR